MGKHKRVGKGVTALAFVLFAGMVWILAREELGVPEPTGGNQGEKAQARTPRMGDVTAFAESSDGRIFVFADKDAAQEWLRLAAAGDTDGMQLMWTTPAVNTVESGTECRVLSTQSVGLESFKEVRVLGGNFYGRSFLIRTEDLSPVTRD